MIWILLGIVIQVPAALIAFAIFAGAEAQEKIRARLSLEGAGERETPNEIHWEEIA